MKSKQKFFSQIQRIFTWSNKGGTDTFFTCANICAIKHTRYCYISGWTENKLAWGFRLYIDVCTVTCNIWQAPLLLFFRSHGDTRVRTFFIVLQSNIFGSTTIKLKWQTVKHLFKFYMELDGISSTSFQVFDYADIKGKRQRNLKPL